MPLSLLLHLAFGCQDSMLTVSNVAPEATITYPIDAAVVPDGYAVEFIGNASDNDDANTDLTATWYRGPDIACEATTPAPDGTTTCSVIITTDAPDVTLEVRDPSNSVGSDSVSLVVDPTDPPSGEITAPLPDGVYYSDQLIAFEANVSDTEDAPADLSVLWTSSLDSLVDDASIPDSAGHVSAFEYLSEGEHALTLTVSDTTGKTGTDNVVIDVGPPNSYPTCDITFPAGGTTVEHGSSVTLGGLVDDVDVPEDWLSVSWSSDWDGLLGTSTPSSEGEVAFSLSSLSVHTHAIAMTVTDEVGATCTDFVLLTVGSAPSIEIVAPLSGDTFVEDETVAFDATVSDNEDVPADVAVEFTSSLSGTIWSGHPDSSGRVQFAGLLPVGTHTVEGRATDSSGLWASDLVVITVDACTSAWYADADRDGWGDPATRTVSCDMPYGYVSDGSDCDDTLAAVNPAAIEACNGWDDDCDGSMDDASASDAPTWYGDADGDGYGDAGSSTRACTPPDGWLADDSDCDDADASVHPEAPEWCDGLDTDCDGVLDEDDALDAVDWYRDLDADGYGDASEVRTACTLPTGYTTDATDCDDTRGTTWPGAAEYCNSHDDDCDGRVDEDDAVDASSWYTDGDADGYGAPGASETACTRPAGMSSTYTDCDDADATIHPGATEGCNSADDDCDGTVDEGVGTNWYRDADGDGYGDPSRMDTTCDVPTGYVADDSDCDDDEAGVNPSAVEVCDGLDQNCNGAVDEGVGTTWYRDADGDGYGDPSLTSRACSEPSGYVADNSDCDDGEASAFPGGTEICDGADNDCDGTADWEITGLHFATPTDTVRIADSPWLDMGTEGTMEAWVWYESIETYGVVFNKWTVTVEDKQLAVGDGIACGSLYRGPASWYFAQSVASTALSVGEWSHLAFAWDATGTRFYLNGTLSGSDPTTIDPTDGSSSAYIGGIYRDGLQQPPLYGVIAEVRISTIARYSADFHPEADLVVDGDTATLWRLDDGSGKTAFDSSGHGLNGTITGATWLDVPCRPGW